MIYEWANLKFRAKININEKSVLYCMYVYEMFWNTGSSLQIIKIFHIMYGNFVMVANALYHSG